MMHVITFITGLLLAGFGAWLALDSRVTKVETTIENAHLAEVPQRLATIETLLRQSDKDGLPK